MTYMLGQILSWVSSSQQSPPTNQGIFPTLPVELMEKIFSYIENPRDARALASTCEAARRVFISDRVSTAFIENYFRCTLSPFLITPARQLLKLQAFHAGSTSPVELAHFANFGSGVLLDGTFALTPDGSKVIVNFGNDDFKVLNLATGQHLHTLRGEAGYYLAITPDSSKVIAPDNAIPCVWDVATGERLHILQQDGYWGCTSVSLTSDGSKAISSGNSQNRPSIWDIATGQCLHTLTGHTGAVGYLAFTPDGSKVIMGSYNGADYLNAIILNVNMDTLRVWDVATGQLLHTLTGPADVVQCLALTPDGSKVISGSSDKTLHVWDIATGQLLHTLTGHTDAVQCLALTPDGSKVISGSSDRTLHVWDIATGQLLHTLTGHTNEVQCLALTPDGSKVISGSYDGTVRVWDLTTGRNMWCLQGRDIWGLGGDPSDRLVKGLTLSSDGMTLLFQNELAIHHYDLTALRESQQIPLKRCLLAIKNLFRTTVYTSRFRKQESELR